MPSESTPPSLPPPHADRFPKTETGLPRPLGVYLREGGTNFAVFSRHASRVWLELYDEEPDAAPAHRFEFSPDQHRTGDIWHIWVDGVAAGQFYGDRTDGPYAPREGHRFNPHRLLIDPCAHPRRRLGLRVCAWLQSRHLGPGPLPINDE